MNGEYTCTANLHSKQARGDTSPCAVVDDRGFADAEYPVPPPFGPPPGHAIKGGKQVRLALPPVALLGISSGRRIAFTQREIVDAPSASNCADSAADRGPTAAV